MRKVSLEEKRLETLRRQLQGKSPVSQKPKIEISQSNSQNGAFTFNQKTTQPDKLNIQSGPSGQPESTDTGYLKRDLSKILILSTLAIGFQLCLYLASVKHLINLQF